MYSSVPNIQAIVVLYQLPFAESPSCMGLEHALAQGLIPSDRLDLLVADNSPDAQPLPPAFAGAYLHDGTNPGLARRYNQALARALDQGASWLLLLDHDTHLTDEYLHEVLALAESLEPRQEIAIVVPKLTMDGRLLSPHGPRYRAETYTVDRDSYGIFPVSVRAFNSGALMRVSALQAIGGFPEDYWLDYLDHATMHRIQQHGGRVFVMHATLEHELSDARRHVPVNPVRLANRLAAEELFYTQHGTFSEHAQHRFDLLRQVVGWGRRGHFRQAYVRLKVLLKLA